MCIFIYIYIFNSYIYIYTCTSLYAPPNQGLVGNEIGEHDVGVYLGEFPSHQELGPKVGPNTGYKYGERTPFISG